jgi:hypothetical protein
MRGEKVIDNADQMLDSASTLAVAHVLCRATLDLMAADRRDRSYTGDSFDEDYLAKCQQRAEERVNDFWKSLFAHTLTVMELRAETLEQLVGLKIDGELLGFIGEAWGRVIAVCANHTAPEVRIRPRPKAEIWGAAELALLPPCEEIEKILMATLTLGALLKEIRYAPSVVASDKSPSSAGMGRGRPVDAR